MLPLAAVHREHSRRTQGSEGITHQEVAAPEAPAGLLAGIARLLAQALQHPIELAAGGAAGGRQQTQAEARLARFLLTRLGNDQTQASTGPISLGMSQSELALLLGASRQKVNSALATLEETGAIRRSEHGLVCAPAALRQIARQD